MEFLSGDEALDMPDRIEEVNAKHLESLIGERLFMAVLFCKNHLVTVDDETFISRTFTFADNALDESTSALQHLENIDDKADRLGIAFVKVNDLELVDEYGLTGIPSLVYYRHGAPILYEGDINDEEAVLEWLVHNRSTGDDEDVIEDVSPSSLEAMLTSVENLAVLFC